MQFRVRVNTELHGSQALHGRTISPLPLQLPLSKKICHMHFLTVFHPVVEGCPGTLELGYG